MSRPLAAPPLPAACGALSCRTSSTRHSWGAVVLFLTCFKQEAEASKVLLLLLDGSGRIPVICLRLGRTDLRYPPRTSSGSCLQQTASPWQRAKSPGFIPENTVFRRFLRTFWFLTLSTCPFVLNQVQKSAQPCVNDDTKRSGDREGSEGKELPSWQGGRHHHPRGWL